jgi:hypothetical protein
MGMKNVIILFSICLLLSSCKSHYFYSYNKEFAIIKDSLVNIEIRIKSYPGEEDDILTVGLNYIDSTPHAIFKKSIKIYPVINETKDTLKFISEYASQYDFEFYKKWPEKIDVSISFDMDSMGFVVHKSLHLKGLNKSKNVTYGFATH